MLAPELCYSAMLARDRRFDGHFFVAVSSTHIYCRPICTVKVPRFSNCRFYTTPARAESEGYRPCRRCRPELAPGLSSVDAIQALAVRAAALIDAGAADEGSLRTLALRLGVSDRHLRRVFDSEFGVSPVQWAQTRRLLLAKQLLTDTCLPITQIAYASGFSSVRRFNALFLERYRLNPLAFRGKAPRPELAASSVLNFTLAYRPPYAWQQLMAFLEQRSIPGIDQVFREGDEPDQWVYRRTLQMGTVRGWIEVQHAPALCSVRVRVSSSLTNNVIRVLELVRRVFDLGADPQRIEASLAGAATGLVNMVPGLRVPGAFGGLECAIRAVIGQQVTVKAATTLASRLVELTASSCDLELETPWPQLHRVFPAASDLASVSVDSIAACGIIGNRAMAIQNLARLACEDSQFLTLGKDFDESFAALLEVQGIGEWTASYVAMRALHWPDSFLAKDVAVLKAMDLYPRLSVQKAHRLAQEMAQCWRPWRSYAVLQLWNGAGLSRDRGEHGT